MRKVTKQGETNATSFGVIAIRNDKNEIKENDHPKTWNLKPKDFQIGTKINAQIHQQSMPTLVTEKIMNIIKHHVSLNGKNI